MGCFFVPRRRSVAAIMGTVFTSDAIERERSMSLASEQVSAVGFKCTPKCTHCAEDLSANAAGPQFAAPESRVSSLPVAHWIGGPTTSKLYFSAIDRSVSPSPHPAVPRMISQIHLASRRPTICLEFPHVLEGMCGASRNKHHRPRRRAHDLVTQLHLKLALHDVEEFILGFVDVRGRPALRCDGLTK